MTSTMTLAFVALVALSSVVVAQPPPKKFIKDAVTQRTVTNPAWDDWNKQRGKQSTVASPHSLPIVSTIEEIQDYVNVNPSAKESDGFTNGLDKLQDENVAALVGSDSGSIADGVFEMFDEFDIPIGMLSKLMELKNYDVLCFLIDDSWSMLGVIRDPGQHLVSLSHELGHHYPTRWTEACHQILTMLKVLKFFPKGSIEIHFLNLENKITLSQQTQAHGQSVESPQQFYRRAEDSIYDVFRSKPSGRTPMLRSIQNLLNIYSGRKVVHYWFGDGQPTDGPTAVEDIKELVVNRPNPIDQPITFVSCSDNDADIKWMKDVEEVAPYCAEMDDFVSEQKEVRLDQGDALPYSYGMYLVCLLVGAMNPNDLDAFDESVPMTKFTLESLQGVTLSIQEYFFYFDSVVGAQMAKQVDMSLFVRNRNVFATHEGVASSLPFVKKYKEDLAAAKGHGLPNAPAPSPYGAYTASAPPMTSQSNYPGYTTTQGYPSPQSYAGHPSSGQSYTGQGMYASGYTAPYASAGYPPSGGSAPQMPSYPYSSHGGQT